jgi:hypothetical protein
MRSETRHLLKAYVLITVSYFSPFYLRNTFLCILKLRYYIYIDHVSLFHVTRIPSIKFTLPKQIFKIINRSNTHQPWGFFWGGSILPVPLQGFIHTQFQLWKHFSVQWFLPADLFKDYRNVIPPTTLYVQCICVLSNKLHASDAPWQTVKQHRLTFYTCDLCNATLLIALLLIT